MAVDPVSTKALVEGFSKPRDAVRAPPREPTMNGPPLNMTNASIGEDECRSDLGPGGSVAVVFVSQKTRVDVGRSNNVTLAVINQVAWLVRLGQPHVVVVLAAADVADSALLRSFGITVRSVNCLEGVEPNSPLLPLLLLRFGASLSVDTTIVSLGAVLRGESLQLLKSPAPHVYLQALLSSPSAPVESVMSVKGGSEGLALMNEVLGAALDGDSLKSLFARLFDNRSPHATEGYVEAKLPSGRAMRTVSSHVPLPTCEVDARLRECLSHESAWIIADAWSECLRRVSYGLRLACLTNDWYSQSCLQGFSLSADGVYPTEVDRWKVFKEAVGTRDSLTVLATSAPAFSKDPPSPLPPPHPCYEGPRLTFQPHKMVTGQGGGQISCMKGDRSVPWVELSPRPLPSFVHVTNLFKREWDAESKKEMDLVAESYERAIKFARARNIHVEVIAVGFSEDVGAHGPLVRSLPILKRSALDDPLLQAEMSANCYNLKKLPYLHDIFHAAELGDPTTHVIYQNPDIILAEDFYLSTAYQLMDEGVFKNGWSALSITRRTVVDGTDVVREGSNYTLEDIWRSTGRKHPGDDTLAFPRAFLPSLTVEGELLGTASIMAPVIWQLRYLCKEFVGTDCLGRVFMNSTWHLFDDRDWMHSHKVGITNGPTRNAMGVFAGTQLEDHPTWQLQDNLQKVFPTKKTSWWVERRKQVAEATCAVVNARFYGESYVPILAPLSGCSEA